MPTTNFILKWNASDVGAHQLDENLSEVVADHQGRLRADAAALGGRAHRLHARRRWSIQRFGDIKRLVEQTLDPMVSAYFKNIGQTRTLIELMQERSEIQRQSGEEMKEKFARYNLELQEVLIGTPHAEQPRATTASSRS